MTLGELLEVINTSENDVDIWGRDIDTGYPVEIDSYDDIDSYVANFGDCKVVEISAATGGLLDVTIDYEVDTHNDEEDIESSTCVKAPDSDDVVLEVDYESYGRYGEGGKRVRGKCTGATLLDALKDMVDRMVLYIDSDMIEDEGYTADEVIDEILSSNGDGCDYILTLKNVTTGETYINEMED